jgi:hypothetical protein
LKFTKLETVADRIAQEVAFIQQLHDMLTPNGIIYIVSSFNLLWIPAAVAAFQLPYPSILRRWLWLVSLIIAMIIFLNGSYGRSLFLTFPVIIPLALIGIRHWVSQSVGTQSEDIDGLPPIGQNAPSTR